MHPQADPSLATGTPPHAAWAHFQSACTGLPRVQRCLRAARTRLQFVCAFPLSATTTSHLLPAPPTPPRTTHVWLPAGGQPPWGSGGRQSCPSARSAAQTALPCSLESCSSSHQSQPRCLSGTPTSSWPPFSLAPTVSSDPLHLGPLPALSASPDQDSSLKPRPSRR